MNSQVDAEYEVLTNSSNQQLLAEIVTEKSLTIAQMERLRVQFGQAPFEAALRITKARQKALLKFPNAELLWLDPVRVEQATHQTVALHKALRFQGLKVADICCGLGGDTMALAEASAGTIALDLDSDCLRRLQFNLNQLNLADKVALVKADANQASLSPNLYIHIDPDRRAKDRSGRPKFHVEDFQPALSSIFRLMQQHPGGAIKLSPGSDFETLEHAANQMQIRTELELISLNGECKEATLWFGALAGPCHRSVTTLPINASYQGELSNDYIQIIDTENIGPFLFEVDAALVRSGLAPNFAKAHKLELCMPDGAYLSGSDPNQIQSPWLTRFEVLQTLPPDRKSVRQALQRQSWPTAVVKTRGRIHADEVLKWLEKAPSGNTLETLFVWTSPNGPKIAILARRLTRNQASP